LALLLVLTRPAQRTQRAHRSQAAPADGTQKVFSTVDRAIEVVQGQGVQVPKEALDFFNAAKASGVNVDPAIVNFFEANKGLIPN
jgi:hypothetical protein